MVSYSTVLFKDDCLSTSDVPDLEPRLLLPLADLREDDWDGEVMVLDDVASGRAFGMATVQSRGLIIVGRPVMRTSMLSNVSKENQV